MGINSFLGKQESRVDRFEKAAQGLDKEAKRKLEMSLLKPEKIAPYTGEKSSAMGLGGLTVKMVLPDRETFDIFSKYFHVAHYKIGNGENSTTDIGVLLALLEGLESGQFRYRNGVLTSKRKKKNNGSS